MIQIINLLIERSIVSFMTIDRFLEIEKMYLVLEYSLNHWVMI
jgi:hypothetical protein